MAEVRRDESLNVIGLLSNGRVPNPPEATETEVPNPGTPSMEETPGSETSKPEPVPEKRPMSALDRAILAKKNSESGLENDVEATEAEEAPLRPAYDTDEDRERYRQKLMELDDDAKKARAVLVVRSPQNSAEYAQMITEVSAVSLQDDGTAIVPEGAQFIVAKTPELEAYIAEQRARKESGEDVAEEEYTELDAAKEKYKQEVVRILIDKTGMGANITFDDEDKKYIERASMIQLYEVENKDLQVVDVERMEDDVPFMQAVAARQPCLSKVSMAFPGSGFKADMAGMSWGEFADVTLDTISDDSTDLLNFDKLYRRYSVIYNKMKNVSVGPFKDFDDFLHKFAYDDSDLAVYGLTIATQPEIDSLYLNCQEEHCKRRFLYKYSPRGVIDLETATVPFLEMLDKINDAAADEKLKLFKNSAVQTFKRVRLDVSGYLVDIGLASAWDYLYQILPVMKEYDAIEEEIDAGDPRRSIPYMLFGIRNIFVPLANGGYARASRSKDIADVILSLPTQDAVVLEAAVKAYRARYSVGFSLKDIVCPYCGNVTKRIPIDIDQLVFQIRLHQNNTIVRVKNFLDF